MSGEKDQTEEDIVATVDDLVTGIQEGITTEADRLGISDGELANRVINELNNSNWDVV